MIFVDAGSLLTTSDVNLRSTADLENKRIAVILGTTTERALIKLLKDSFITTKLVPVKDHLEGLAAIDKGVAEAFASDRGILIGLAVTSKDPARFSLANVLFSYEPYGAPQRWRIPVGREPCACGDLSLRRHQFYL